MLHFSYSTLTAILFGLIWQINAWGQLLKTVVYKLMTLHVKWKQTWNCLMIPFRPVCCVTNFSFPFVTVICNAIKHNTATINLLAICFSQWRLNFQTSLTHSAAQKTVEDGLSNDTSMQMHKEWHFG